MNGKLLLFLFLFIACTNKKNTAIDSAIKSKEDRKGVTIKHYDVIAEKRTNNSLTVYYSAKVVSPVSLEEIFHHDSIKLSITKDGRYVINNQ